MSKRTAEANRAVKEAWERERLLVLEGKGTRNWTEEQQRSIIDLGKAYGDDGKAFEGHHMKSAEKYPKFQGDANNIADAAPVAWQQIIGVYAFHIPYLGYISIYAKTPLGIAVVCGVLIVLILLNFIPDILEEDKKKNLNTE